MSFFADVFIVVQPVTVNGKQKYRLSCGSKDGVPAFGPDIPDPAVFEKNELFRSFVLAKRKFDAFKMISNPSFLAGPNQNPLKSPLSNN